MAFNCTLCYLENDRGEYLMLHRVKKKNDVNQDKWIGVGGKFEENESPDECLIREVREETGLTLTDYPPPGDRHLRLPGLGRRSTCSSTPPPAWTGELLADCDEGTLEWVDKKKVGDLPIWEGDELFFRQIEDPNSPFFSLKLSYRGDELVYAAPGRKGAGPVKEKLLVSACLLGRNCKYNGGEQLHPRRGGPEGALRAGARVPGVLRRPAHPPSALERWGTRYLSKTGEDVTAAFRLGAEKHWRPPAATGPPWRC